MREAKNHGCSGLYIKRYFKDRTVAVPLTTAYYLTNAEFPSVYDGWLLNNKFVSNTKDCGVLLLEMSAGNNMPAGSWSENWENSGGAVQLAIKIENIQSGMKIVLNTLSHENIYLINNFDGLYRDRVIKGEICVSRVQRSEIILSGDIVIGRQGKQVISFQDSPVKIIDLKAYVQIGETERAERDAALKRRIQVARKVSAMENDFYGQLFNYNLYPHNNLVGQWPKKNAQTNYSLNPGYIAKKAEIVTKLEGDNPKIDGNDISGVGNGSDYVLYLSCFDDPNAGTIGGETDYLILIQLNDLICGKSFEIGKQSVSKATFFSDTYCFGPTLSSTDCSGTIYFNSVNDAVARGNISIIFNSKKNNAEEIFGLNGEFELPIINNQAIIDFKSKVKKFKVEEESKR